jgi:Integrase core domain
VGTFGVPEELLTDNGKQFTDRFGRSGEVLFDRICRDNGISHRLTPPPTPTTTGKIERFHQSLKRELVDHCGPFESIQDAQAVVDTWVEEYNTRRPRQALDMAYPADRFFTAEAKTAQAAELLPLKLPATLAQAVAGTGPAATVVQEPAREDTVIPGQRRVGDVRRGDVERAAVRRFRTVRSVRRCRSTTSSRAAFIVTRPYVLFVNRARSRSAAGSATRVADANTPARDRSLK